MDTSKLFLDQIKARIPDSSRNETKEPAKEHKVNFDLVKNIEAHLSTQDHLSLNELMRKVERTILVRALSQFNGNQKNVARFLGIKYTTLHEKVKKYNIRFQKTPIID